MRLGGDQLHRPPTKTLLRFVMAITYPPPSPDGGRKGPRTPMERKMKATLLTFAYAAVTLGFLAVLYSGAQNGLV